MFDRFRGRIKCGGSPVSINGVSALDHDRIFSTQGSELVVEQKTAWANNCAKFSVCHCSPVFIRGGIW